VVRAAVVKAVPVVSSSRAARVAVSRAVRVRASKGGRTRASNSSLPAVSSAAARTISKSSSKTQAKTLKKHTLMPLIKSAPLTLKFEMTKRTLQRLRQKGVQKASFRGIEVLLTFLTGCARST
jgi:hypothetical protein